MLTCFNSAEVNISTCDCGIYLGQWFLNTATKSSYRFSCISISYNICKTMWLLKNGEYIFLKYHTYKHFSIYFIIWINICIQLLIIRRRWEFDDHLVVVILHCLVGLFEQEKQIEKLRDEDETCVFVPLGLVDYFHPSFLFLIMTIYMAHVCTQTQTITRFNST